MRTVFGSWSAALEAAGLDPEQQWTERRIVEALQADAARRGRPPSESEWARRDRRRRRPTAVTVKTVFGSWNTGLGEAGLETRESGDPRPRKAA